MLEFAHGHVSIAPVRPVPLAGWAGGVRIGQDLSGSLEANILAIFSQGICSAVLVSIDVLFVGRELSEKILTVCHEFSVPSSCVLILATHTHSAPALEATKPKLGPRCDEHFAEVKRRLTEKLKAVLDGRPQKGSLRRGRCGLNAGVNRRRPWPLPQITREGLRFDRVVLAPYENGKTAPIVTALVIRAATTCVIWHYTCHPTAFPESQISADYPGVVRQALRQRFGEETTSIFLQGFAGDIRPPSSSQPPSAASALRTLLQGPRFQGMTFDAWARWADGVADGVLRAIESADDASCAAPVRGRIETVALNQVLEGADPSRQIEVQHLDVFGETILAVSAEPLSGLAALAPENTLLVGYSRDVFGYWPCDADVALGGYEVNGFKRLFEVEKPWRPGLDGIFRRLARR
ncbi:hypothetical protein JQ543_03060 [Bradyrhizobium diazoefficiens]|nr:hypothetical protein [Bradyrhizobium diazoefficiens]